MNTRSALCVLILACGFSSVKAQNIVGVVQNSSTHTTLLGLITRATLADTLSGAGPYTLFAPNDAAFAKLDATTELVKKITANPIDDKHKPLLQDILKFHVLGSNTSSSQLPATATNTATLSPGSTLSLKNVAPQVGTATVVTADIMATNGYVHVIDTVQLPPSASRTVVQVATAGTAFTSLVKLLTAADLVSTLSTDTKGTAFTVFAPNDAAFAKIPAATLTCLGLPANKAVLANLLKLHVVDGTVVSSALTNNQVISTLANNTKNTLTYTGSSKIRATAATSESTISTPDLLATNGVVHVIDTVLIPTDFSCNSTQTGPVDSSASALSSSALLTVLVGALLSLKALVKM